MVSGRLPMRQAQKSTSQGRTSSRPEKARSAELTQIRMNAMHGWPRLLSDADLGDGDAAMTKQQAQRLTAGIAGGADDGRTYLRHG